MTRRVILRPAAEQDLIECAIYLGQNSTGPALRFLDAAEDTLTALPEHAEAGSPYESANPSLAGLRKWPIKGFRHTHIFYLIRSDHIDVVRILHGARDPRRLLEDQG